MERTSNYRNNRATLYLISTPIGNMEDITLRALKTLKDIPLLFAEDTRVSQKLLKHYEIDKPLQSLHEHNEMQKADFVLGYLAQGTDVGLMSDAGMPLLHDPGKLLVQKALEAGYNVVCLPGANAALTGLVMSGIDPTPFYFAGFLDPKTTKRQTELRQIQYRQETLVFYEAPHRIQSFLKDVLTVLGDRRITILREMTKTYEEIIRGTVSEIMTISDWKGELVVVLAGYKETNAIPVGTVVEQVDYFIRSGLSKTDAMKKVSEMTSIPKNEIYREYLDNTRH
jgi:16S rRNA (cytidine1402-2'-O)-methyltransferase